MYPRLDIHEAEADQLREALSKRDRSTILIYGESGVGKTTLIEQLLQSIGLSGQTLRHELIRNHCSLRAYLNSLFSKYHSDAGFVRKLLGTRIRLRSAKFSATVPTSVSFKRSATGVTIALGGWPDEIKLVLEGTTYRINGSTPSSFFRRFWALLESQGIRLIWIANAELIPDEELYLLSELCRSLPETFYVLIEMGSQQGGVGRRKAVIEQYLMSCQYASVPIEIPNLNFAAAKRFHERMSRTLDIPPFDFAKNNGLPLSIVYDISFAARKYGVHKKLSSLARTKAQRSTLLILTILFGVIEDAETLYAIAKDAKLSFDVGQFIDNEVVERIGSRIYISHPLIGDFVVAEYREDLSDLLKRLLPALRRRGDTAYLYLRLRFSHLLGQELEDSDWQWLIETLIGATTTYEVNDLIHLLPWVSAIADQMPERVRYICDFIITQNSIYHYDFDCARLAHHDAPIDLIARKLLELQSLYHKNRFGEAIAAGSSQAMIAAVARLPTVAQQTWALSIREALLGVCHISLGHHDAAKEALASASRLSPAYSLRGRYLALLDDFIYGEEFLASRHFVTSREVPNNYIQAKSNHNIFASRISAGLLDERSADQFLTAVIEPFNKLQSQEITYAYNNLGVLHIVQERIELGLDVLRQAKYRVFEIYDAISCLNNLIVAHSLLGNFNAALSAYQEVLDTLSESQFNDPSFIVKPQINASIVYYIVGEESKAQQILDQCRLPEQHMYASILDAKLGLIRAQRRKIAEWQGPSKGSIYGRSPYWLQVLEFWDYNIPIIDVEFFSFTGSQSATAHGTARTRSATRGQRRRRIPSHGVVQ